MKIEAATRLLVTAKVTSRTVEKAIKKKFDYDVKLYNGKDYFYFADPDDMPSRVSRWKKVSVYVTKINQLSLDQWLEEFEELIKENKGTEASTNPIGYDRKANALHVQDLLDNLEANPSPLRKAWIKQMGETVEAAVKKPSPEFLLKNEDAIINAFNGLNRWYGDNADRGIGEYLPKLQKLFDYVPYAKPLYRAFPMPSNMVGEAKEKKTYNLKTGNSATQSWTTDVATAQKFIDAQDYKTSEYGIFKLKSEGKQLCNFKWIRQVVEAVIKACEPVDDLYEMRLDAKSLLRYLDQFEKEKEIILKLPNKSDVVLMRKL